jgi:hypothetical protein
MCCCGIKKELIADRLLMVLASKLQNFQLILIINSAQSAATIYLWRKVVMFVCLFVCHIEICLTMWPLSVLLVLLEGPQWVWVHQAGFIMFQPMVEKLLNKILIENSFKPKLKIIGEFRHSLGFIRNLSE